MTYLVTGATGFIGRHLVVELLRREGVIHVLVRPQSDERLARCMRRWGSDRVSGRVVALHGDLNAPRLGVADDDIERLRGNVDHLFHLAASYDITADARVDELANVQGTRHAIELARAIDAGCLHHISSIAVAGDHAGVLLEDALDVGQRHALPYERTKFIAEQLVRATANMRWRIYRPGLVIGSSITGEADKIDGPYYFFKAIRRLRHYLPEWLPLAGPELGRTNIVPVDFVARAIDHIAHAPGLDGQAFHLTSPEGQSTSAVLNEFARAAHAPQVALRVDRQLTAVLPTNIISAALALPAFQGAKQALLAELGIPPAALQRLDLRARFDTTNARRALAGSGIEVPPLSSYAARVWDYWERELDPERATGPALAEAARGRVVLITGGSSGIGRAAADRLAAAGATVLLVARDAERLERACREIAAVGGSAIAYEADLSRPESIERLVERLLADHARIDFIVNNAGRSIRRSLIQSRERPHDFERTMALNYFGAIRLVMGLLPRLIDQGGAHVVNVSSIGVQTSPPRFSAYIASKAALDAWTRTVASELVGEGITFTTVHMPLVRTPMIAPTKLYESFPTASPEEAAELVCRAIATRPKHIGTRLGTLGEIAYALAPKAVDQILHTAYRVFPDSGAVGLEEPGSDAAGDGTTPSPEALALAHLMRGVHW